MKYKGLVPEKQSKEFQLPLPRWQYGEIRDGKKIIDPILQYGCYVLGYQNKEILDFVMETMQNNKPEIGEMYMPRNNTLRLNHISFEFADKINSITGMNCFFALSGSDSNEGAVKLASAYHYEKGNTKKKYLASFEKSYHGSTYLTSSLGHDNFMDNPFYTMESASCVKRLPRDFDENSVDWSEIAAFVLESCPYGFVMEPPSSEFWAKLDKIRSEHDVLIIIDDIFMGGGKTGTYVGWENMNIKPDISTMGKAITAGFFPLSMVLYNDKIKGCLPNDFNWEHGFTYNFSLPGIASATKYLEILERENLLSNHKYLVQRARSIFEEAGYEVRYQHGLHFKITKDELNLKYFYIIPVNATDEYFEVLKENLEWFIQNTTH